MRILVVEDNANIAKELKRNFEAESFAVDTAADGEKGSFDARTNTYDLIILDNILPKKEGLTVCREIRAAGKNTPIIMLSVCSEIPEKVTLLQAGIDDYVTKPYSFEELLARCRAVLRRGQVSAPTVFTCGDILVDCSTQEIRQGDKTIYLTRKEFSLLELLIKNSNKVVSRGMIMEHVWNMDSDPFSRTIDTHILNLRKKIEGGPRPKLIHNVPGRGYKICPQSSV
jgi:DNA-binding response OmpR family regulator